MNALGIANGPVVWLGEPDVAMGVAVAATAWRSIPLPALLLLAALKTIPDALYRAARMDGAGSWASFRYVTLPAIRNTLLIVTILSIILSLQVFDVLFTLTGGGPGRSTTVISYYVWETTVKLLNFGYSAALAIFLLGVIVLCSSFLLAARLRGQGRATQDEDMAALTAIRVRPDEPKAARLLALRAQQAEVDDAPERPRRELPRWLPKLALGVGVGALLFWLLTPIVWIGITSLQPEGAVTTLPLRLTPELHVSNYTQLLTDPAWIESIMQSLVVTIATAVIAIVLAALAAYPLARLNLPGKGAIISVLIFTQMVPAIVLAIPILLAVQNLGVKDTIFALVVVNVAFWMPLIVWLLRGVFEEVPRALESAARIDGCSRLGTLFRITIPAAAPGIAAVAILLLIGTWNEFLFAVIIGDREVVTVTRRIGYLPTISGPEGQAPFTLQAAAAIVAILPCLVLVLAFHRRLVQGLSQGFVKG
jgi:multiple sugar transport system permease protein